MGAFHGVVIKSSVVETRSIEMQRMLVYASRCVTAKSHGWSMEFDDTDLELRSPDGHAELRVRPYQCASSPALSDLHALISQLPESHGKSITETQVGQYYGYVFDSVDPKDGMFIRDHVVSLAEIVLDITFFCPDGTQDQYLPQLQPILESLCDNRP